MGELELEVEFADDDNGEEGNDDAGGWAGDDSFNVLRVPVVVATEDCEPIVVVADTPDAPDTPPMSSSSSSA